MTTALVASLSTLVLLIAEASHRWSCAAGPPASPWSVAAKEGSAIWTSPVCWAAGVRSVATDPAVDR
jgi:hypothetical protein